MKKILLVEDDTSLGETLTLRLRQDYEVHWSQSCADTLKLMAREKSFDLILFDVGLPDGNGFDLAKQIRAETQALFAFLTAQADAESRLRGFEIGAQEFIPKPFHLKELLMRVAHVLSARKTAQTLELSDCTVNFDELSVRRKNGSIEYPALNDIKILKLLIDKSPQVLSRDEIIDQVWGVDKNPSHRSVDNIIVRLRQLLGTDGEKNIRSIRGVGYQWMST